MIRRLHSRVLPVGFGKTFYRLSDGHHFLAVVRLVARFFDAGAGRPFRTLLLAVSFAAGLRVIAAPFAAEGRGFGAAFLAVAFEAVFDLDFCVVVFVFRGFEARPRD